MAMPTIATEEGEAGLAKGRYVAGRWFRPGYSNWRRALPGNARRQRTRRKVVINGSI
jgi:hypothetical protein